MKDWISALKDKPFSRGRYSQSYQDVLIDEIFANIGTVNTPPFCVEFGFNSRSLVEGSGANVANLVINKGWRHLLIDGNNENLDINLRKHFLYPDNICDIFRAYDVPKTPDYVSIDVDSCDLWLFRALLREFRASLFSVEYHPHFPLDASITFPDDPSQHWEGDRGYGASLRALTNLAESHGYALLWVVSGLDAFFIRNDLIDDKSGNLVLPIQEWANCTNKVGHLPLKDESRLHIFVDYDEFVASDGKRLTTDTTYATCKAFLTDSVDIQSILRRGISRLPTDVTRVVRKAIRGGRRS